MRIDYSNRVNEIGRDIIDDSNKNSIKLSHKRDFNSITEEDVKLIIEAAKCYKNNDQILDEFWSIYNTIHDTKWKLAEIRDKSSSDNSHIKQKAQSKLNLADNLQYKVATVCLLNYAAQRVDLIHLSEEVERMNKEKHVFDFQLIQ
ncbi:MAG: hypothetical protein IJU54_02290 [Alphaproteobacteria bacterium]|nr:hypothetical protein [Alphaproteobacteria bacterium]